MAYPVIHPQKKKNFFSCYDFDDEPEYRLKMKQPKPQKVQYVYQPGQQLIQQPQQTQYAPALIQSKPQLSSSIVYSQPPMQQPMQSIPSYSYRQAQPQVMQPQMYQGSQPTFQQPGMQLGQPGMPLGHSIVGNVQQPLGNSLIGQPQFQAAPFQR